MKYTTVFFSVAHAAVLVFVGTTTTIVAAAQEPTPTVQGTGPVDFSVATQRLLNQSTRIAAKNGTTTQVREPLSTTLTPVPPAAVSGWQKSGTTSPDFAKALLPTEPPMISRLTRLAANLPAGVSVMDNSGAAKANGPTVVRGRRTLDQVIRATGWTGNVIGRSVPKLRQPGEPDPEVDPLPPLIDASIALDADTPGKL